MRYLLDTNVVSEPLTPAPNPRVLEELKNHQQEIAIASVVWHELVYGARRLPPSKRHEVIEAYLFRVVEPNLPVLPYDTAAAAWHGQERARLQSQGLTPPFVDGQVAAIARVNGLVVVTRNVENFCHFEGLVVENWFAPKEG